LAFVVLSTLDIRHVNKLELLMFVMSIRLISTLTHEKRQTINNLLVDLNTVEDDLHIYYYQDHDH